ncbi:hypothetical protein [Nocardioides sp. NPDC000441]|uniref:hypothetical protein n=1 Tax=Nocardioides sp. NPDC000441 TaxID=3154256 RepID=UPI003331D865
MKLPLYGWLAAETISLVGTRISMLALPWFVLETTGSPAKAGLIALFEMTPLVLSKIFGGPIIDRIGPRRVAHDERSRRSHIRTIQSKGPHAC